jgi:hypothetical protein
MPEGTIEKLRDENEIELTVTGRKSGKKFPRPVWFAVGEGEQKDSILFLPVAGSSTQWYKNVLKNQAVGIKFAGRAMDGKGTPIEDKGQVDKVVQLFTKKYGAGDMKKYYSKLDVAVKVLVTSDAPPEHPRAGQKGDTALE